MTVRTGFTVIALAMAVALVGCATTYKARYDIGLDQVERPVQPQERYGEQRITTVEEKGDQRYRFEDKLVATARLPTTSQLLFRLENKTDHSIKIFWDEAAFVDQSGESHRVMHSGVKFIDRNDSEPSTVVVRGGTVNDLIYPTDYAHYSSVSGWLEAPLFPVESISEKELREQASAQIGATVQVLLPLEIEGVVNEYIFTFKVANARVEKQRSIPMLGLESKKPISKASQSFHGTAAILVNDLDDSRRGTVDAGLNTQPIGGALPLPGSSTQAAFKNSFAFCLRNG